MKRFGNLWNTFISKENFYLAWLKTAEGRRDRQDIQNFEKDLIKNLEEIRQEVISGKFKTSNIPQYFLRKKANIVLYTYYL